MQSPSCSHPNSSEIKTTPRLKHHGLWLNGESNHVSAPTLVELKEITLQTKRNTQRPRSKGFNNPREKGTPRHSQLCFGQMLLAYEPPTITFMKAYIGLVPPFVVRFRPLFSVVVGGAKDRFDPSVSARAALCPS